MSVEIGAGPAHSQRMSDAAEFYERDFYAWTQDQAALLRAWPEALRPNALDLAHLAKEIEDLGRSQRGAIESLMTQVVEHMLKLRCHPDQASRRHWQKAIAGFRDKIDILFRDNPSLRARRAEIAATVWRCAARRFGQDLETSTATARARPLPPDRPLRSNGHHPRIDPRLAAAQFYPTADPHR